MVFMYVCCDIRVCVYVCVYVLYIYVCVQHKRGEICGAYMIGRVIFGDAQ